jgi:ATP-binding cassette, subfamily G (WHITE), member 2, PDR
MASTTPFGVLPQSEQVANEVGKELVHDDFDQEKTLRETTPGDSILDSSDEGEKIHKLARALTEHSIVGPEGYHINPFDNTDNPLLDPTSDKFNYRAWTKNLLGLQSRDPERYPQRVAGIAYKNLSAHGFGEATDYQKTFGNYPLETASLFKRLIGKRQQTKIQILRNFDGLVRSGEMLVVLGRPGRYATPLFLL